MTRTSKLAVGKKVRYQGRWWKVKVIGRTGIIRLVDPAKVRIDEFVNEKDLV